MGLDKFTKQCDCCRLFLQNSDFYKNKAKLDGFQNRCKDCIKDYRINLKKGLIKTIPQVRREIYYIPDLFLVGYARCQTYQHCCLNCNDPFFCLRDVKEPEDLFCDGCTVNLEKIPEKNLSPVNFIGNVIGWMAKVEDPRRTKSRKNYKKCYERDKYICQYCGYTLKGAKIFMPLHIDHIKPSSCQGGNSLNNLTVACEECNVIASDKWFNSFEEKKEYILFEKQKKHWVSKRASNFAPCSSITN